MDVASVFVQIGPNPAPQLISMANCAAYFNPNTELFLITDLPELWSTFPGKLIRYSRQSRHPFISNWARKAKEVEEIAGGYWLYTLERLFALESIYTEIGSHRKFLHYESDVLPMIREDDCSLFTQEKMRTSVPRFSGTRGIASVMFVPSREDLNRVLTGISEMLQELDDELNDMDILGKALNSGLIDELPTSPGSAWQNSLGEKVIFDGAALGQYLFGQDPFHTNNRRISGYLNPNFESNLKQWKWNIVKGVHKPDHLVGTTDSSDLRILNLHVHSKLVLEPPGNSLNWERAISEANGKIPRVAGEIVQNLIHTKPISTMNRIRIAKRKGLAPAAFAFLLRRLRKFMSKK